MLHYFFIIFKLYEINWIILNSCLNEYRSNYSKFIVLLLTLKIIDFIFINYNGELLIT